MFELDKAQHVHPVLVSIQYYCNAKFHLQQSLRYIVPRILLHIMRTFIPFRDFERGSKVSSATIFSKLMAISFI
jgi:hypothetical protein